MIINPYNFGASQLLNEQFEGPGASGWTSTTTSGYSAWVDTYQPAIVGSYSAQISSASASRVNAYKNFTAAGSCYMRFQFKWLTAPTANSTLVAFRDASGNILATLGLTASSTFRISIAAGASSSAAQAPLVNTNYYGWLEYQKGSGNAIGRAGWSTEPSRPSWPTSAGASGPLVIQNTGTSTADAARVLFGRIDAVVNYNFIIDDIQIQSTPFA
jgi:hypothetical protein